MRLELFNYINKKDFIDKTYNSSKKYIDILVGELCRSDINVIQLPNDEKSLLKMHTDFLVENLNFKLIYGYHLQMLKTQSMFIINPLTSLKY